jgi:hypothetical protein
MTGTETVREAARRGARKAAAMTRATASLMDHLQEQGYEPLDIAADGDWFDLVVSGIGTARVCLYPDDGYRAEIDVFDGGMACEWSVNLSSGTPDAAIIAVVEAAEWELAAKRGGPVTPAQEEAAR